MSSSSSLQSADLTSAKHKIAPFFADFGCLPRNVTDPLWDRVESEANLTLAELGALKNARSTPVGKSDFLLFSFIPSC